MSSETPKIDPKQIPPASFSFLISTLAAQAMTAMGQAPDPRSGKKEVQPELARHFIDSIAVLEEKTKGNLTTDEAQLVQAVLHQLRIFYVEATSKK